MGELQERFENQSIDGRILKAFSDEKIIFFIGAGVSRLMGVPGWDELADKLIKGAFTTYKEQQMILSAIKSSKEKITIAYQKFCRESKEEEFFKIFGEAFENKKVRENKKKADNIYNILAKFPAIFLTTNADNLFESALGKKFCHTVLDMSLIRQGDFTSTGHLFYLHGKYSKSNLSQNQNMVFTASQYVKRYNENTTIDFLKEVLGNEDYVVIFLGYGLNEFELIDYIVTKTNIRLNERIKTRLFMVEGFYSNQDEIYEARKSYFDSLNIQLIPYCLDNIGYDELRNVLKLWKNELDKKSILPALIHDNIENYAREFNYINAEEILRILNARDCNVQNENKVVEEIRKSKDFKKWVQFLISKGVITFDYLIKIMENGNESYPILELFRQEFALKRADKIQEQVVELVDTIITKNLVDNVDARHLTIFETIVNFLLILNGKYLKYDHIIFIEKIIEKMGLFWFLRNENIVKNIVFGEWSEDCFKEFISFYLKTLPPINSYEDIDIIQYKKLIDAINLQLDGQSFVKWRIVVESIVDVIKNDLVNNKYGILRKTMNLTNINKNHSKSSQLLIKELTYAFSKLSVSEQLEYVNIMFSEDDLILGKFALYLCRVVKIDLNKVIEWIIKCFDRYDCGCELWLNLKDVVDREYNDNCLTKANEIRLLNKIKKSHMGFGDFIYNDGIDEYIISRRVAFVSLLRCVEAQKFMEKYKNVFPYDFVEQAELNDYDDISTQEVSVDTSLRIDCNHDFINSIREKLAEIGGCWQRSIVEGALETLFAMENQEFSNVLDSLINEDEFLLNDFVINFYLVRETIDSKKKTIIFDFCLNILMTTNFKYDSVLYKHCFRLVASEEINSNIAEKVKKCLVKWLQINDDTSFLSQDDIHMAYVNHLGNEKFRLLIYYLIYLKETNSGISTERVCNDLKKLIQINSGAKYYLAYEIQSLHYVLEDNIKVLIEVLVYKDDRSIDIDVLMLCTLYVDRINKYLIDILIKDKLLFKYENEISNYRDKKVRHRFYSYIIAAYFYDKLSIVHINNLLTDYSFIEEYMRAVRHFGKMGKLDFEVNVCQFYNNVKDQFEGQERNALCREMFAVLEFMTKPTATILNTYCDVIELYSDNTYFFLSITKMLDLLEVDYLKAGHLIKSIVEKREYWLYKEIEEIIKKIKECSENTSNNEDCTLSNELLNILYAKKSINMNEYKKLS